MVSRCRRVSRRGAGTAPAGRRIAVSVVPVIGHSGEVMLIRQYRAAVDRDLLEIPAGKRDVPGEPPQETARRELLEEQRESAAEEPVTAAA